MPTEGAARLPDWTPGSWRGREALQQPEYPDAAALERALGELGQLPPLVTSWEIVSLREQMADAACGRRFVLQGGDCAERFADCTSAGNTPSRAPPISRSARACGCLPTGATW
jgi:3-deoxy-7-phosphoheptulonate synthase